MNRRPKLETYKLFYEQIPSKTRVKKAKQTPKAKTQQQLKISVFA